MKIVLQRLEIQTKRTPEVITFSPSVTYIYGPVGKGKSTVARIIDFCFGGVLENTPAIQREFVSASLYVTLGKYSCILERSLTDSSYVRVTWDKDGKEQGSINAPLQAQANPILDRANIFSLSDLVYHLCGITPIKVRQRSREVDSPLIRLGFRDLWRYCYLEQTHLDSSFFRFEDPFRKRKSQDAMRFFTGLHSERLNQLENDLIKTVDEQRGKREAVKQIRAFMSQFKLGSEADIANELARTYELLSVATTKKQSLQSKRNVDIHPTDSLREMLLRLGEQALQEKIAIEDAEEILEAQKKLHAELITAKIKHERISKASILFNDVVFEFCPACGSSISSAISEGHCCLCGAEKKDSSTQDGLDNDTIRKDLNVRIDELSDSIKRREHEIDRMKKVLSKTLKEKAYLDQQLQNDLRNYDSAIVEELRIVDREIATYEERIASIEKLQAMPKAISDLEKFAGGLQGEIDRLRSEIEGERNLLLRADEIVHCIADEFKKILLSVQYPGVYENDHVIVDSRDWTPYVSHGDSDWGFWDTGSGGKKTLFNVCYTLALHTVAIQNNLPVPSLLIIDSPTKNISDDENPELVTALYQEIYRLAKNAQNRIQILLIDSDFVAPPNDFETITVRRMAGTAEEPSLISYYDGP